MKYLGLMALPLLTACSQGDPNNKPVYGNNLGLPANCRAYIQQVVNDWRRGAYSSEVAMNSLERNCGEHGELWDYKP